MSFLEISPGDELWVVNGTETSVFEADVTSVTEHTIAVRSSKKHDILLFDRETGKAMAEFSEARLILDEDPLVRAIRDRKEHTRHHQKVMKLTKAVYENPGNFALGMDLTDAVTAWREFIVVQAKNPWELVQS